MSKEQFDINLGQLELVDTDGVYSYLCKLELPVSRKLVEVFFETDSIETQPSSQQKRFLQYIIENYSAITNEIASKLPAEIAFFGDDKASFLRERFDLDTLGIPINTEKNVQWDLSVVKRSDRSMSILADFDHMKVKKVWVEMSKKRSLLYRLLLKLIGN